MFHAFRCVLDYWKLCVGRFGLGFNSWCNLFLACHMFMHTYYFIIIFELWLCFVSLSLSLSRIDCAWNPSTNLLRHETLLVSSFLLLILFPFFTFGSMMGRPCKTSLRTFRNLAFIRSAMSFCRNFPTLLYPMSFRLGDENLFVRYPWGALSCLYRSFTPIYMVSIPVYLDLPRHFEVHIL